MDSTHPLSRWRKAHGGLTQAQLAEACPVDVARVYQSTIARIENRSSHGVRKDTLRSVVAGMRALRPGRELTLGQLVEDEPYAPSDLDNTACGEGPCALDARIAEASR